MPTALDMAGPILEVLTWLCLPAGLGLLFYTGFLRRFVHPWEVEGTTCPVYRSQEEAVYIPETWVTRELHAGALCVTWAQL